MKQETKMRVAGGGSSILVLVVAGIELIVSLLNPQEAIALLGGLISVTSLYFGFVTLALCVLLWAVWPKLALLTPSGRFKLLYSEISNIAVVLKKEQGHYTSGRSMTARTRKMTGVLSKKLERLGIQPPSLDDLMFLV